MHFFKRFSIKKFRWNLFSNYRAQIVLSLYPFPTTFRQAPDVEETEATSEEPTSEEPDPGSK